MGTEAKTAEEEFDVMSCPKFVKVGTQRNKAEAFAMYKMFSIGEQKIRNDGEYLTRGRVGRGDGVRGKGRRARFKRAMSIFELLRLVALMPERKRKKKFLVSMVNEPEDEVELWNGATLSQCVAMLLERKER
eukprot:g18765.t1